MDIIELHKRVHARIIKAGGTERTTDAVMWIVRAALRTKDVRITELEAEHGGPKCVRADIYDQVCAQMHDAHEEAEAAQARVRELEESVRVHRESIARLDSIKAERGAQIVELEEESQRLRDVLENVSCAGTLDEVSDALDKANDI